MRALAVLLLLGLALPASADIRPDPSWPRQPRPTPSDPPAGEPRGDRPPAPAPEPRPEKPEPKLEQRGCASREAAPEWLFGLGVLGLGIGGLRRSRGHRTARAGGP